jgi:hypothetical protein
MSSPHQGIVSLDSCSSSSSESSSSAYSTVSPNQSSSKNKGRRRTSHTKKKKKHNDKFLISANQWTPIVGAPVPKINKKTTEKRNPQETLVDPITHAKLVNLFEPSSHVSSARSEEDVSLPSHPTDQEVQQPILVTIEEKVSLYVNCFEEMLNTVLRYEAFLFLPSELRILSSWQALPRKNHLNPSHSTFANITKKKTPQLYSWLQLFNEQIPPSTYSSGFSCGNTTIGSD